MLSAYLLLSSNRSRLLSLVARDEMLRNKTRHPRKTNDDEDDDDVDDEENEDI